MGGEICVGRLAESFDGRLQVFPSGIAGIAAFDIAHLAVKME
jgi:hypothetical protein